MAHRRRRPRRVERYTRRILYALLDLYRHLRAPQPIDALLQAILDTAVRTVPGAQRGSLMVIEGGRLHYRAAHGYDLEALRLVSFPPGDVAAWHDRPITQVSDFSEFDERFLSPEANSILREHGMIDQIRRSMVCTIIVGGQLYATLVLDNLLSHRPFPREAETLTLLFAEQAGALLEQAMLMEQIHQARSLLVEAEKLASLGRFIASIAHEINNPLTAVLGYADFLSGVELGPEPAAMLAQLRLGAERMRAIVRSLLVFARQQRSGSGEVNLNLLVEQALLLKQGELSLEQIVVEQRLDPDLPITWGDGGQLSQVLLNLLTNAQHALAGRPHPRQITISTALVGGAGGQQLRLRVADNGPGIAPEVRARIFEPFFTTKAPGQGTGLGLSICKGIVVAHGGALDVESGPGAGATFTLVLPMRPVPEAAPMPEPAARGERPAGLSVLLVDDDPFVVDVVLRSLEGANRVEVAHDGEEGLRVALHGSFDLVLSDLRMPRLDGLQLYERLAAARPDLARRVLFISGDATSTRTREALQATGRPLLRKPFWPEELYGAIAALWG